MVGCQKGITIIAGHVYLAIYMCRNTDVSVLQKCLKLNTAVNDGMYSVDPTDAQGDWCCTSKGSGIKSYLQKRTRYDTRSYFNVRSKAEISQLNLPHGMRDN